MTIQYKTQADGALVSYRQGDCLLVAIESMDEADKAKFSKVRRSTDGRIVLLEGEVTGHAHAIADRAADLFEVDGLEARFLQVLAEGGVQLKHEEHATIDLPAGMYEQRRQTETFERAQRFVAD